MNYSVISHKRNHRSCSIGNYKIIWIKIRVSIINYSIWINDPHIFSSVSCFVNKIPSSSNECSRCFHFSCCKTNTLCAVSSYFLIKKCCDYPISCIVIPCDSTTHTYSCSNIITIYNFCIIIHVSKHTSRRPSCFWNCNE